MAATSKGTEAIVGKNQRLLKTMAELFFTPKPDPELRKLESGLAEIILETLAAVELSVVKPASVVSFGSTTRDTHLHGELDFDFVVQIRNYSTSIFFENEALRDNLKRELYARLASRQFGAGSVSDLSVPQGKTWSCLSIHNLSHPDLKGGVLKVDLILNRYPYVYIGLINKDVLARRYHEVQARYGDRAYRRLTSQIRLVKFLFKQELAPVDDEGRIISDSKNERICDRSGLRSIHIELALTYLALKLSDGEEAIDALFHTFFEAIFLADQDHRDTLPTEQRKTVVPLALARRKGLLAEIGRQEVIEALQQALEEGLLPQNLTDTNSRLFDDFQSSGKWRMLVKMARDYFQDPEFLPRYLPGLWPRFEAIPRKRRAQVG